MTELDLPCIVCPVLYPAGKPRMPQWKPVCESCRVRVRRELGEIPEAYARVADNIEAAQVAAGERVSGSRTPPIPVRLDALNLIGPGSEYVTGLAPIQDQIGDPTPVVALERWVRDWMESGAPGQTVPQLYVASLVGWLLVRLDWALDQHPAIDEFASEMNQLLRTLRGVARSGRDRGERVGHCPAELRDGSACGTRLYVDPYADHIQCGRCSSDWPRIKWLALRAAQDEASEAS